MKAMFVDVKILVKFFVLDHEFVDFFLPFSLPDLMFLEFSSKIVLFFILIKNYFFLVGEFKLALGELMMQFVIFSLS